MNLKVLWTAVAVACAAGWTFGAEKHVDEVVKTVLENVTKLRTSDPAVVPMAFWDFDGTIIKGDVSVGLLDGEGAPGEQYKGLLEETILSGLCPVYEGPAGWRKFWQKDYPSFVEVGRWLAWPFLAQMYAGVSVRQLDDFCRSRFRDVYRHWYFASSLEILRRLERAGVRNYIVSASPELFVRNAAETLNLPPERFVGIRVEIDGDVVTRRVVHPLPMGGGKAEIVRRLVAAEPHGVALAAFGNSYSTDGAFLRHVVGQRDLPGGAQGFALMINGGREPAEYRGLFKLVRQDETADGNRTASRPDDETIRVVQWNMGHFALGKSSRTRISAEKSAKGAAAYRAKIAELRPDILGVSEFEPVFDKGGGLATNLVFASFPTRITGPRNDYQSNAVFTRFACVSNEVVAYANRQQEAYYLDTVLKVGTNLVHMVQSHLDWNSSDRAMDARPTQIRQLIERFRNEPYVILCADYNVYGPGEYLPFEKAGFRLANGGEHGLFMTTPAWKSKPFMQTCLDNVIVKGFKISGVFADDDDYELSDHKIIGCTLKLEP